MSSDTHVRLTKTPKKTQNNNSKTIKKACTSRPDERLREHVDAAHIISEQLDRVVDSLALHLADAQGFRRELPNVGIAGDKLTHRVSLPMGRFCARLPAAMPH